MSLMFGTAGEKLKAGDLVYRKRIRFYKAKTGHEGAIMGVAAKTQKKGEVVAIIIQGIYLGDYTDGL